MSRLRRFGKSYATKMVRAYYDCVCDSYPLFDGLEVARIEGYEEHINRYNVINLDVAGLFNAANIKTSLTEIPNIILNALCRKIVKTCPELEGESFTVAMSAYVEKTEKSLWLL